MSIKYALLGLVGEEPMHGYRLKATFDRRVGGLWKLTTAQIYQTLNALERAGLVGESRRAGRAWETEDIVVLVPGPQRAKGL